jgi:hypothetical protein
MLNKEQLAQLYANGKCECKASGRFRWQTIEGTSVFMCTKCKRPVYWTTSPPAEKPKKN